MKAIFKGNNFAIVWNIIDSSTHTPFDFSGMKVEVGLYSECCKKAIQTYNISNGTIEFEVESEELQNGVYNLMCRYSTENEQAYCIYKRAFQITGKPEFASNVETIILESKASHIDATDHDDPIPDFENCQLIAQELFKENFRLPQLTAERAIADEHGNRIVDTYVSREAVTKHIRQTYNQQFLENPPLITEGYITPQMLSDETRQLLEESGATINNLPDGEDLQSVHGVLKLANKQHNPNSYSGLGRQYLRKNIVAGQNILTQSMLQWPNTIYIIQYDYDLNGETITIPAGCTLQYDGGSICNGNINYTDTKIQGYESLSEVVESGTAIHTDNDNRQLEGNGMDCVILKKTPYLTQDMVSKPNTIYIIRYNYDLNEAEITIPENCVLQFEGGSLSNGKIIGNNTAIKAELIKIFSLDIEISGSWNISEAYPEWFGAKGDERTDDTNALQASLQFNKVLATKGYKIKEIKIGYGVNFVSTKLIIGRIVVAGGFSIIDIRSLWGSLVLGSDEGNIGGCQHNRISFNSIAVTDGEAGIILNANINWIMCNEFYGGNITGHSTSSYKYGVHFIKGNPDSFANQNLFVGLNIYKASEAAVFMETRTDRGINGNTFVQLDPEGSSIGIKMGRYVNSNTFLALRTQEFYENTCLIEFDEGCQHNKFYTHEGVLYGTIRYVGNNVSSVGNFIYGGIKNRSYGLSWANDTIVKGEYNKKVALYPIGDITERIITLTEDSAVDLSEYPSRNLGIATCISGNKTLILNNSFGFGRRSSMKVFAPSNEIPSQLVIPLSGYSPRRIIDRKNVTIVGDGAKHILVEGEYNENDVNFVLSVGIKTPNTAPVLKLRIYNLNGDEIRNMNIVSNQTIRLNLSGSGKISIELDSTPTSGEFIYEILGVFTNAETIIRPSVVEVTEDTMYKVSLLANNNCSVEKIDLKMIDTSKSSRVES